MKRLLCILVFIWCLLPALGQTLDKDKKDPTVAVERDTTVTVTPQAESADTVFRTDIKEKLTLFYRFDNAEVDSIYLSNAEVLRIIDKHLTDSVAMSHLDSLSLSAISSPEGPLSYNQRLSERRVNSFRDYLLGKYSIDESKIKIGHVGEEWGGLRNLVVASTKIPNKQEVLDIIDSDLPLDVKEYRLKHLGDGKSWRFIVYNMLRYLRHGATSVFYYDEEYIKGLTIEAIAPDTTQTEIAKTPEVQPEPETEATLAPVLPEELWERKPLFAFKTNLLFDAATVLNISAEVPLGDRFSVAGEWVFPWWTWDDGTIDSQRNRLQLLYGNIEGRYWFGDRTNKERLTGWFAGLYAGSGKYDFEYHKEGVQGEFYTAGVTAGYAHSINKSHTLRMEYSLTAGYLNSDYRNYDAMYADSFDGKWHPIRRTTGNYSYFGPTSVKVSLVWMLYYKRKVKGGLQ